MPNHLGSYTGNAGLSLFLLKGIDGEVGPHRTEFRIRRLSALAQYQGIVTSSALSILPLLAGPWAVPAFWQLPHCWYTLNSRSGKLSNLILLYAILAGLNHHILHSVNFLEQNSGICITLLLISLCGVLDRDVNQMVVRWSYVGLWTL